MVVIADALSEFVMVGSLYSKNLIAVRRGIACLHSAKSSNQEQANF